MIQARQEPAAPKTLTKARTVYQRSFTRIALAFIALAVAAGVASALPTARPAAHRHAAVRSGSAFAGVLTWHNDLARTGQNPAETVLTLANVRAGSFGKRFSRPVDGMVYAQPLYVPGVAVRGLGTYDLVVVATEHDSVYAFDASGKRAAPLWHASFIDPSKGITTVPCTNASQPECDPTILVPEHGITGTPVVDPATNTVFAYAKTLERGRYFWRLHALDLSSGMERHGSPIAITASAPGFPGARFDAEAGFGRSALALGGRTVYVAFASNDDARGWLIGYDARTLAQTAVLCVAPKGGLGGIWMAGAAPAFDAAGNLYVTTGNGSFDADSGGPNYGMSLLRMTPALAVADYFAPSDELQQSAHDLDFASSSVMVLPAQSGSSPNEAIASDKKGWVFVVDRDHLGGFDPHANHVVQQLNLNVGNGGSYSDPAYFGGAVYYAPGGAPLERFPLTAGLLSQSPASQSPDSFNYPGATPAISSNGTSNAIVWTVAVGGRPKGGPPAELRAYDASNVAKELYSSAKGPPRDRAAPGTKFSVPTVAAGMVYFGTQTELEAYGPSGSTRR